MQPYTEETPDWKTIKIADWFSLLLEIRWIYCIKECFNKNLIIKDFDGLHNNTAGNNSVGCSYGGNNISSHWFYFEPEQEQQIKGNLSVFSSKVGNVRSELYP